MGILDELRTLVVDKEEPEFASISEDVFYSPYKTKEPVQQKRKVESEPTPYSSGGFEFPGIDIDFSGGDGGDGGEQQPDVPEETVAEEEEEGDPFQFDIKLPEINLDVNIDFPEIPNGNIKVDIPLPNLDVGDLFCEIPDVGLNIDVMPALKELGDVIVDKTNGIVSSAGEVVGEWVNGIGEVIDKTGQVVGKVTGNIIDSVKGTSQAISELLGKGVNAIVEPILDNGTEIIDTVVDTIVPPLADTLDGALDIGEDFFEGLDEGLNDQETNTPVAPVEQDLDFGNNTQVGDEDALSEDPNAGENSLAYDVGEAVGETLQPLAEFTGLAYDAAGNIVDETGQIIGKSVDAAGNILNDASEIIGKSIAPIAEFVAPLIDTVDGAIDFVGDGVVDMTDAFAKFGGDILASLTDALNNGSAANGLDIADIMKGATIKKGDGAAFGEVAVGDTGLVIDTKGLIQENASKLLKGTVLEGVTVDQLEQLTTDPTKLLENLGKDYTKSLLPESLQFLVDLDYGEMQKDVGKFVSNMAINYAIAQVPGLGAILLGSNLLMGWVQEQNIKAANGYLTDFANYRTGVLQAGGNASIALLKNEDGAYDDHFINNMIDYVASDSLKNDKELSTYDSNIRSKAYKYAQELIKADSWYKGQNWAVRKYMGNDGAYNAMITDRNNMADAIAANMKQVIMQKQSQLRYDDLRTKLIDNSITNGIGYNDNKKLFDFFGITKNDIPEEVLTSRDFTNTSDMASQILDNAYYGGDRSISIFETRTGELKVVKEYGDNYADVTNDEEYASYKNLASFMDSYRNKIVNGQSIEGDKAYITTFDSLVNSAGSVEKAIEKYITDGQPNGELEKAVTASDNKWLGQQRSGLDSTFNYAMDDMLEQVDRQLNSEKDWYRNDLSYQFKYFDDSMDIISNKAASKYEKEQFEKTYKNKVLDRYEKATNDSEKAMLDSILTKFGADKERYVKPTPTPAPAPEKRKSGTVLCTALYNQGYLSEEILNADLEYAKSIDERVLIGYRHWATPIAKKIDSGSKIVHLVKIPVDAWANQMAFKVGVRNKPNYLGKFLEFVGVPVCFAIGSVVRYNKRKAV